MFSRRVYGIQYTLVKVKLLVEVLEVSETVRVYLLLSTLVRDKARLSQAVRIPPPSALGVQEMVIR
jgi:hypothetical protein